MHRLLLENMNRHKRPDGFFRFIFPFRKADRGGPSLAALQKKIGYRFRNLGLLTLALTHKSNVGPDDKKGLQSNERLEFLGDAVLNCLVTEHLYRVYPGKSEGQLSKVKSLVVSRKILGEIAQAFCLGDHLLFGYSEKKSGGNQRLSILSNAFEAVLGALYLDGGLEPSRTFLTTFLFRSIDAFLKDESNINYKSRILELSQHDGFGIPKYRVVSARGPEHAKEFTIDVAVGGVVLGEGEGSNKKLAEQNAARAALLAYNKETITHHKGKEHHELVSDRRTADDH
jgi:ribonuclease III